MRISEKTPLPQGLPLFYLSPLRSSLGSTLLLSIIYCSLDKQRHFLKLLIRFLFGQPSVFLNQFFVFLLLSNCLTKFELNKREDVLNPHLVCISNKNFPWAKFLKFRERFYLGRIVALEVPGCVGSQKNPVSLWPWDLLFG